MKYALYNDDLCPKLWEKDGDEYVLRKEVRDSLMSIAESFVKEYLEGAEIHLIVKDTVMVGSSTNYNWTEYSDIDLHIIVDYSEIDMNEKYVGVMLSAIRSNWNKTHKISIKGMDVEVYVENENKPSQSASRYSVKEDKWLKPPSRESPEFNKELIKQKHSKFKKEIEDSISNKDENGMRDVLSKLYKFRQAGLDKQGEFSAENLVFKILRAQGYLDKIKEYSNKLYDEEMTLKEAAAYAKRLCEVLKN